MLPCPLDVDAASRQQAAPRTTLLFALKAARNQDSSPLRVDSVSESRRRPRISAPRCQTAHATVGPTARRCADSDGRCRRSLRCAARPASSVERAGAGTWSTPKGDSQEREALRLTGVDGPRGIRIKPDRTTRVRHLIDTRMGLASDTESRA